MNAKEAARRQKLIASTLEGMNELLTTNLHQEMDPEQEKELYRLAGYVSAWVLSCMKPEAKQP